MDTEGTLLSNVAISALDTPLSTVYTNCLWPVLAKSAHGRDLYGAGPEVRLLHAGIQPPFRCGRPTLNFVMPIRLHEDFEDRLQ